MRKVTFVLIGFLFFSLSLQGAHSRGRSFIFQQTVEIYNLRDGSKDLRVWIPYPAQSPWQEIEEVEIISSLDTEIIQEKRYGNKILYLYSPDFKGEKLEINLKFKIKRSEYDFYKKADKNKKNLFRFLRPSSTVPVNGSMRKLAKSIVKDKKSQREQIKALYDYLIAEFDYSKEDLQICGIGNSLLTLKHKKGNCSDYHSVFLSLARSLKIPAKFEIGYPLNSKTKGEIGGYHCWTKYYEKGKGWFGLDISEADKHPEKGDYFFGRLDENRVLFVTGRDINLPFAKDKESMPLNFFIYPYAEIDGEQFFNVKWQVYYSQNKPL